VTARFEPLRTPSKLVIAALAVSVLGDLFAMWVDVREIQLMNRVLEGELPEIREFDASDSRQATAGAILLVTFIATMVVFLVWFSRAYKNVEALGATGMRFSHGWATGAWFVPILNLWRPKQIANDIWRASDPKAPAADDDAWRARPVPFLLTAWWVTWIASVYAWNVSTRLFFSGDGADDLRNADYADLLALGLDIAAAALAIAVVVKLTARQTALTRTSAPGSEQLTTAAEAG